jgi:hypothetical protein
MTYRDNDTSTRPEEHTCQQDRATAKAFQKPHPRRREVIRDTERGLVFVPLAGGRGRAVVDLEDFERLTGALSVSDQWYLNANGTGSFYVRSHRLTTDTRSLLSVANEIARAGRGQQVAFIDGNRLNLRRSNLRLVVRRGPRMAMEVLGKIHVPDNDRS